MLCTPAFVSPCSTAPPVLCSVRASHRLQSTQAVVLRVAHKANLLGPSSLEGAHVGVFTPLSNTTMR